jgi:hypothetical protein
VNREREYDKNHNSDTKFIILCKVTLFLHFTMQYAMKVYEKVEVYFNLRCNTLHMGKQFEHLQHGHKDKTPCCCSHIHSSNMEANSLSSKTGVPKPSFFVSNICSVQMMTATEHTTLDFYYSYLVTDLSWYYSFTRGCDSSVNTMTGLHARQAMNRSQNVSKNLFWHFSVNEKWDRSV